MDNNIICTEKEAKKFLRKKIKELGDFRKNIYELSLKKFSNLSKGDLLSVSWKFELKKDY